MTDSERVKCHAVIHTATAACAAVGGGLAQIPGSDYIPISAAQITMVIGLGKVFDMAITEAVAQGILKSFQAALAGRFVAQFLGGWIPMVGNFINAATAVAITEYIGWLVADKFDREAEREIEA